jgi:SAM-dependent methyltransferase
MTFKSTVKNSLKWLDAKIGIRAWLSSEPKEKLDEPLFLKGEKDLDYAWVVAHVGHGPGKALDVGFVNSPLSAILLALEYSVTGIDLRCDVPYELKGFTQLQGDITRLELEPDSFDLAILCSTVEHVGLSGRYDNRENPDGDLQAMTKISEVLRKDGKCILTIPVGLDGVYSPWHRVYGEKRLPLLLDLFKVEECNFYMKSGSDKWKAVEKSKALAFHGSASRYALGQFVLSPKKD